MRYRCDTCDLVWFPYMYKEFDACPKCGGGTRRVQEQGSIDAEAEYRKALDARKLRDEAKAREVDFEEYYAAHCHNELIAFEVDVQRDLAALPVAEPRRDLAT